jgi:hypothetical protein
VREGERESGLSEAGQQSVELTQTDKTIRLEGAMGASEGLSDQV